MTFALSQPKEDPVGNEVQELQTGTYCTDNATQTVFSIDTIESLKYTNKVLTLKIRQLQTKFNKIKQELLIEKDKNEIMDYRVIKKIKEDVEGMDSQAIFLMDQINNYKKKKPNWSEMTIRQCITWRYCSPKGYEYPRHSFLKLPCKSTLNKYLASGNQNLIENRLMSEIKNLNSVEKFCSLIIDDMAVKEHVTYSKLEDKIFGLAYNNEGKEPKIVNQLLCFVIQGLTTKYIIPASYHFHRQLNSEKLHELTLDVLKLLSNCGFIVIRIVADNHKSNTALFRRFGKGQLLNYIQHPFNPGFNLFFSFDYCHLLKNARNIFLDHDMASTDGIISASYLKELYQIQEHLTIKPVRFLRKKHLYPSNFQKMKVYPAVQIFSPPVTASLKYLSEHGGAEFDHFKSCLPTVVYMETMYKFFQVHDVSNRKQYIKCRDSNTAPYLDFNDERLLWPVL